MPLQRREDRLARVAQTGEKKFPVLDKTVNCQGGVTSWVRRKKMPICPQDPYHILRCPLLIHTSYWVGQWIVCSTRASTLRRVLVSEGSLQYKLRDGIVSSTNPSTNDFPSSLP